MSGSGAARDDRELTLDAAADAVRQRHPTASVRTVEAGFEWLPGGEGPLESLGVAEFPDRWHVFATFERARFGPVCFTLAAPRAAGGSEPDSWMPTLLQHLAEVVEARGIALPTSVTLPITVGAKHRASLTIVRDPDFGRPDMLRVRLPRSTVARLEAGAVARVVGASTQATLERHHPDLEPLRRLHGEDDAPEATRSERQSALAFILLALGLPIVVAVLAVMCESDDVSQSVPPTASRPSYQRAGDSTLERVGTSSEAIERAVSRVRERRRGARTPSTKKLLAWGGVAFVHGQEITSMAASSDGRLVATGDAEGVVRTMDAGTGAHAAVYDVAPRDVTGMAFSPENRYLLTWSRRTGVASIVDVTTSAMRTFDLAANLAVLYDRGIADGVWLDADTAAVVSVSGSITKLDASGEQTEGRVGLFTVGSDVAISRDAASLLYEGTLGRVQFGDGGRDDRTVERGPVMRFGGHRELVIVDDASGRPQTLVLLASGRSTADGQVSRVVAYRAKGAGKLWTRRIPAELIHLTGSPDGLHVAALSTRAYRVLRLRDGETVHFETMPDRERATAMALDTQNGRIWIGTRSGKVMHSSWGEDE